MTDTEQSDLKFATDPTDHAKGYVSKRRASAINTVNWKINNHPKAVIRLFRTLAGIYSGQTRVELNAVADDLEMAYEEGFITQGNADKRRSLHTDSD